MKIKLLIITYDYIPIASPNTYRWQEIAEYLIGNEFDVTIITSKSKNHKNNEIINGVEIIRSGFFSFNFLRSMKPNSILNEKKNNFFSFKKALLILHNLTWKKIYWPDFAVLWALSSIPKVVYLTKQHKFDKIITVSRPFSSSLISLFLNYQKTKRHLDYLDPFSFSDPHVNNNVFYRKINQKFEKYIFEQFDTISVLNEQIKNELIKIHSKFENKIIIIPNICNLKSIKFNKSDIVKNKETIDIVYCGSINALIRNPKFFFDLFKKLNELEPLLKLHIYGEILNCDTILHEHNELLNRSIFLYGEVKKEIAVKKCLEADFLLNLGNNNIFQEPSKIIEYISYSKPILNFSMVKNDAATKILEKYSASLTVILDNSTSTNIQIIDNVLSFVKSPHFFNNEFIFGILNERKVENVAIKYL